MAIPTEALLADLDRLNRSLGRVPTPNDVIRDGNHSVNTYYKRFDGQWRNVEAAYESWRETGDLPTDPEPFDWRALHGAASG